MRVLAIVVMVLLGLVCGLFVWFGIAAFQTSAQTDSALHEIEALIGLVIAAVALAGFGITAAVLARRTQN